MRAACTYTADETFTKARGLVADERAHVRARSALSLGLLASYPLMAKAIRKPGTAGVSRRVGGGKVAKKMPTPIAKTKGQASISTEMKARRPPPRTKPSKKRFQQLKKDRERTAAHHREALLGLLEPSVLRDSMAKLDWRQSALQRFR